MKKLYFLPLLLTAGLSQAQSPISLSQADFASAGTTLYQASDLSLPNIAVGSAGASAQIWNFTTLGVESMDSLQFVAPSAAVGNADYPTANIALVTGATSTFFLKSASSVKILGSGGAAAGFGFSAPYNPPYDILTFPATMGTTVSGNSGFDVTEYIGIDTTVALVGNVKVDSIRFKREIESDMTFDAFGTIGLPMGSFAALRAFNTQTVNDSIYVHMGNPVPIASLVQGWNTLTQQQLDLINSFSPGLVTGQTIGVKVTRSYDWYANNQGYRLASIEVNQTNQPVKAQYLTDPTLSINDKELLASAYVYPNPASDVLRLGGLEGVEKADLAIVDLNGKTVMNTRYIGQNEISLTGLAAGTYFLRMTDNGKLLFAEKFQVVK